ncbi:MAG: hypothetical protein H8E63_03560, partial [Proteobacteria bacterium]|nr:hypothetical protein [Pseudomonadota bacterium]
QVTRHAAGVSTFFTLSEFLITGLLVREWNETQRISLAAFWGRRLRRLLPASSLALFAIAVADSIRANSAALERRSKPNVRG